MSIKIGDRVKFLDDEGGGVVVKIIDSKKAMVQTDDGFDVPSIITQLVKIESGGEVKTKPAVFKPSETTKPKQSKPTSDADIKTQFIPAQKAIAKPLLAFVPEGARLAPESTNFDIYMLNDGDYHIDYTVAFKLADSLILLERGTLEPDTKVHLTKISYFNLLKHEAIVIDTLFYTESNYKQQLPRHFELFQKEINFMKETNYKENDFFYDNAFIIEIADKNTKPVYTGLEKKSIEKVLKEKEIAAKPKPDIPNIIADIEEVDLHIEEIVDSISGMTPGEIITLQLNRFTTALDGAIKNNTRRIVFIHGSGSGKLRYEIQKILKQNYSKFEYQDASYAEYGFGATMVIIRK